MLMASARMWARLGGKKCPPTKIWREELGRGQPRAASHLISPQFCQTPSTGHMDVAGGRRRRRSSRNNPTPHPLTNEQGFQGRSWVRHLQASNPKQKKLPPITPACQSRVSLDPCSICLSPSRLARTLPVPKEEFRAKKLGSIGDLIGLC